MSTALSCDMCGGSLAITNIKGTIRLLIEGICPKNHKKHFDLPLVDVEQWLPILTPLLFKCVKCNKPTISSTNEKNGTMEIQITCPDHGTSEIRSVPLSIYHSIMEIRNRPKSGAFCHICGKLATYIPQYSRYYCYKCQQYTETISTRLPPPPSPPNVEHGPTPSVGIQSDLKTSEEFAKVTRKLDILKDRFQFFIRVDSAHPSVALNNVSVQLILPDSLRVAAGRSVIVKLGMIKPRGFGTAKYLIECGEFCKQGDELHATVHFYDNMGELHIARMKSYPLDRCIYTESIELLPAEITQLKAKGSKKLSFDIANMSAEDVQQILESNLNLKPKITADNRIEFMGQTLNHEPLLIDTSITSKTVSFDLYGAEMNQMGLAQVLICLKDEIQQVKEMQKQSLRMQKKEMVMQHEELTLQKEEVTMQSEELRLQKQEVAMQKLELDLEQQQLSKISFLVEEEIKDHCIHFIDQDSIIEDGNFISKIKKVDVVCLLCGEPHQVELEKKDKSWFKWGKIILQGLLCGASIVSILQNIPNIAQNIKGTVESVSMLDLKGFITNFSSLGENFRDIEDTIKEINERTDKMNEMLENQEVSVKDLLSSLNDQEIEALQNIFMKDSEFHSYTESEFGLYVHKDCYKDYREIKKQIDSVTAESINTKMNLIEQTVEAVVSTQTTANMIGQTEIIVPPISDKPVEPLEPQHIEYPPPPEAPYPRDIEVPTIEPPESEEIGTQILDDEFFQQVTTDHEAKPPEVSKPLKITATDSEEVKTQFSNEELFEFLGSTSVDDSKTTSIDELEELQTELPLPPPPPEIVPPITEPEPAKRSIDSIIASIETKIQTVPLQAPPTIEIPCPHCNTPLPSEKVRQLQQGKNDSCPNCYMLIRATSVETDQ